MIAFISSIIADVNDPFPKYAWWSVAYMLCCIVGVTVVFGSNTSHIYSIAVSVDLRLLFATKCADMPRWSDFCLQPS